jgi:hypothetical protein
MRLLSFLLAMTLALPAGAGVSREFDSASNEQLTGTGSSAASPYTFAAWVNLNANADASVFAIHDGISNGYGMRVRDGGVGDGVNAGMIYSGSCTYLTYDSVTVTPGVWAFFAASWDGSGNVSTYYNGTYNTGTEACTDPSVAGIYIGSFGSIGQFYDGFLAHVACWSVALTEKQLNELNQGIVPYMVEPESMTGYWPIIGASPEPDFQGSTNLTVSGTTVSEDGPPVWIP